MPDNLQELGCPLCGQRDAQINELGVLDDVYRVDCPHCQTFKITDEAYEWVRALPVEQKTLLAAYNCHHKLKEPKAIFTYLRDEPEEPNEQARVISEVVTTWWPIKNVWDRLDIVLLNIYFKAGNKPAKVLQIPTNDYPFCFGEDGESAYYILDRLHEAGVIKILNPNEGSPRRVQLTLAGHRKVHDLLRGIVQKESKKVFIAMSFDPSLNTLYDSAIKPAIEACGYDSFRIDRTEHNEKICDKIEAAIRRSRFIVADFTQNKHGVYYEAGLARGLGLQIIWCVKETEIDALHFDTRQYNHIAWKNEGELRQRLEDRIRAMGI